MLTPRRNLPQTVLMPPQRSGRGPTWAAQLEFDFFAAQRPPVMSEARQNGASTAAVRPSEPSKG